MTKIFIFIILFLVIAFDIYIIVASGREASISAQIIAWSYEFPSIPFAAGFVSGHLFWQMKLEFKNKK